MQKVFWFELQFFYSSYKPLGYKLFFFEKKKKTYNPLPLWGLLMGCVLNFMVIGHNTINIPGNLQVFTIFSVWHKKLLETLSSRYWG